MAGFLSYSGRRIGWHLCHRRIRILIGVTITLVAARSHPAREDFVGRAQHGIVAGDPDDRRGESGSNDSTRRGHGTRARVDERPRCPSVGCLHGLAFRRQRQCCADQASRLSTTDSSPRRLPSGGTSDPASSGRGHRQPDRLTVRMLVTNIQVWTSSPGPGLRSSVLRSSCSTSEATTRRPRRRSPAAPGVSEMTFFRHFASKDAVLVDDPYDPLIAEAVSRQPVELPPLAAAVAGVREAWGAVPAPAGNEVRDRLRIVSRTPSLRGALARNSGATTDAIAGALRSRGVPQRDAAHCRGRDDRCAERGSAGVGGRRRPRPRLRDRGRVTSARRR